MATKPVDEPKAVRSLAGFQPAGSAFVPQQRYRSAATPRYRVPTLTPGPSMTKQSFKDECDINVIMKRYATTGVLPGMERMGQARYMDCSSVDYQEAMLMVADARAQFANLPARVRDRFGNDPRRMMEFLEDERNVEEARELGLVKPAEPEATPLAVRVVEPRSGDPEQTSKGSEVGSRPAGPTANAPGGAVKPKS